MLIPKQLLPITRLAPKQEGRFVTTTILMVVVDYPDLSANFPVLEDFDGAKQEKFKATIPAKLIEEAGKTIKPGSIPVLNNISVSESSSANGKVSLVTTDLETTRRFGTKAPEGQFPNYEACLPKEDRQATHIGVDAELLAKMLQVVAGMMGDVKMAGVELVFESAEKPIEIRAKNTDLDATIRAVFMPVRL